MYITIPLYIGYGTINYGDPHTIVSIEDDKGLLNVTTEDDKYFLSGELHPLLISMPYDQMPMQLPQSGYMIPSFFLKERSRDNIGNYTNMLIMSPYPLTPDNGYFAAMCYYDLSSYNRVECYVTYTDSYRTKGTSQQMNCRKTGYGGSGYQNKYAFVPCLQSMDNSLQIPPYNANGGLGFFLGSLGTTSNGQWQLVIQNSSSNFNYIGHIFDKNDTKFSLPKVPNEDGGISQPEGGDGDFDNTSDIIPVPPSPKFFINAIGFTKIYCPTIVQAYQLSRYMWSDDFISNLKDMFTNPMESIIGLYTSPYTPLLDDLENIVIGNVSTPVQACPINFTSQYTTLDFGKIYVKKFWGNYLDYSPNTKMTLYLPYIGYRDIDIDKVMGKNIGVVYRCNILDGTFIAYVTADSNVFAQYNGVMFQSLPLSNYDGSAIISSYIGIAKNVGGIIAGGIAAPATGGLTAASAISKIGGIADNVMNAKPSITVDASISGNAGFFSVPYPYYTITRPRQALPKQYNVLHGYPSFISTKLSSLKGYTEVSDIHLENLSCTDNEREEIENLLKNGVII